MIDMTRTTPELQAAHAKAQGQALTVGKDEKNTQAGYKYASAEAMIRGARKPLADNGLAFFSTWTREAVTEPNGDIGKQFVCAAVRMHWVLAHESGGYISGVADMDAIGSSRRPPDKAVAATLTYMHGFVLREILGLDRAEEDADAVDRREESDWRRAPQQRRTAPAAKPPTAEDKRRDYSRKLLAEYHDRMGVKPADAIKASGVTTMPPSGPDVEKIIEYVEERLAKLDEDDAAPPATTDDPRPHSRVADSTGRDLGQGNGKMAEAMAGLEPPLEDYDPQTGEVRS